MLITNIHDNDNIKTADRNTLISYDIYKAYLDGELSGNEVFELVNEMLENITFKNNEYVHASICKILLTLLKDGIVIDDNDIIKYLEDNSRVMVMIKVNKHFKIIPMTRLFKIIVKIERMIDKSYAQGLLYNLTSSELEDEIYSILLHNLLFPDTSKVDRYRRLDYDESLFSASIYLSDDKEVYYRSKGATSTIDKFNADIKYDVNMVAYERMFDEDKEELKKILIREKYID